MTYSETYQIKRLNTFDRTYQRIIKKHYSVDEKSREELEDFLVNLVELLSKSPKIQPPHGRMERWPKKTAEEGWLFWKLDFHMPGLTGDAGQGRIMYLIHDKSKTIQLFWIYTHADYATRPPDDEIKRILKIAMNR